MPTPAARATASRLASAPPALKTTFAASRTRSRFRTASARGFRVLFSDCLMTTSDLNSGLQSGGILRIFGEDTLTHNPRAKQTATNLSTRRHGGIDRGLRSKAPGNPTAFSEI